MNRETLTRSERVEEYLGENRIKREGSLQETTEGVNILLGDPQESCCQAFNSYNSRYVRADHIQPY